MNDAINKILVFGSQIVTVILVVTGAVLQQSELRSSRPPGRGSNTTHNSETGDRYARLWEDPLANLEAFSPNPKLASDANARPEPQSLIPPPTHYTVRKNRTLVLWQVVDSRPTPEATEWRRRARYATVTALAAAGYEPSFDASLRAIRCPDGWRSSALNLVDSADDDDSDDSEMGRTPDVPSPRETAATEATGNNDPRMVAYFERFKLRSTEDGTEDLPSTISVVWYPEQIKVSNSPDKKPYRLDRHERVFQFLNDLDQREFDESEAVTKSKYGFLAANEKTTICILNHGDSVKLRRYLNKAETPKSDSSNSSTIPYNGYDFFVRATLPSQFVPDEQHNRLKSVQTAMPDDKLFQQLTHELLLRIPSLHKKNRSVDNENSKKPRIVIVTESDGTYGHNLSLLAEGPQFLGGLADIKVYSYLRGLDGLSSDAVNSNSASSSASAAESKQGRSAEQSWGTSQYDYLTRLASSLKRECDGGEPVVAIGVLGSDVYDKLLVLQAFHRELPTPLYFTTDMDNVYLGREQVPFTRNLIIASGEDLQLPKEYLQLINKQKWTFPPMRDTYQTALIRTIFNILRDDTKETPATAPKSTKPTLVGHVTYRAKNGEAKVWEIGSGTAVEFSPSAPCKIESALFRSLANGLTNPLVFLLGFMNAMLIFAIFLSRTSCGAKEPETGLRRSHLARGIPIIEGVGAGLCAFLLCGLAASALIPDPRKISTAGFAVAGLAVLVMIQRRRSRSPHSTQPLQDPVMHGCLGVLGASALLSVILWMSGNSRVLWGETLSPVSGVGIWLSILIRLIAFLVGLLLLFFTFKGFRQEWIGVRKGLEDFESNETKPTSERDDSWWDLVSGPMVPVPRFLRRILAPNSDAEDFTAGITPRTFNDDLEECENPIHRFRRVFVFSLIYLIASMVLFSIWPSSVPARGPLPFLVEKVTLSFGVGLYIIHLCFCYELHGSAFRLINRLADIVKSDASGVRLERHYQAALQVERLTRVVGNTLLYPLTILTLLLLSRLRLFDDWNMMPSLLITFLLGVIILSSASVLLLRAGRKFRANTEAALNSRLQQLKRDREAAHEEAAKGPEAKAASRADAEVSVWNEEAEKLRSIQQGAFAPWYLQPIFTALFAAIAVFGTTSFMEPLLTMFME